jgi:hypothetical protein
MKLSARGGFPVAMTVLVAVFVAAIHVLCPPPAVAKDKYAAIAYSYSQGVCAVSEDYDSKEGAEKRALELCKQRGGTECQIMTSYKNSCGALALGKGGIYGWAWSGTKKKARERAVFQCKKRGAGCKVYCEVCSGLEQRRVTPTPVPVTPRVTPPRRTTCRCCYREMSGGCRRNPRTGRITCVDGVQTKCTRMSISRCRRIGGRCVR